MAHNFKHLKNPVSIGYYNSKVQLNDFGHKIQKENFYNGR